MVYLEKWILVGFLTSIGVWAACYQDLFKILNGEQQSRPARPQKNKKPH